MLKISPLKAVVVTTAAVFATAIGSSWADSGHTMGGGSHVSKQLAKDVADARFALAPYATSLDAAKTAGWSRQITPMMKDMGYHYMDPTVTDFSLQRPPILVYVKRGDATQLVAAEWVFPSKPAKAPLPGATYGSFPAACHYDDGTFVPQKKEKACAPKSDGGAAFTFWHSDLVTLHLWLNYPNPDGIYNSTNPLIAPFNRG
ncbi:hypothetical protein [Solirubrobacter soli]|uniref:hypothetical protein n=1 Tax=Solirubrobacter soli TaxID=363832 RepID=UPI00041ABB15|nr:hypothetical protein [Solirubrobacter soli]